MKHHRIRKQVLQPPAYRVGRLGHRFLIPLYGPLQRQQAGAPHQESPHLVVATPHHHPNTLGFQLHPQRRAEFHTRKPKLSLLRQMTQTELDKLQLQIKRNLEQSEIRHSQSAWGEPLKLAGFRGKGTQLCLDYRGLSSMTKHN
ncbi:hypothetical protein BDK51DRAFT_19210 [Blyttiomyces helicus]|uniref:Uncharacterized protein n=1 Tax=Blyttiomyces helicus TaxID=388810 RepID=A0A4P9WGG5_9FUNG|nr:hypothetical protein BDK51DRAFT_19210 [Blyttiomyces helicus]|eukprot:RKO91794.1 hypothetical protein BDK51DRAFT_19210 [Blyttiomyces helicus]